MIEGTMMKSIHQIFKVHAPLSMVWYAFVDPKTINAWGGGPAKMSDKEDFNFSLWGGDIWGKNLEVIKEEKLVQDWHDEKNNDGMVVTFTFEEKKGTTTITLLHENVPDNKYDSLSSGWKDYYLGPLKELVERSVKE